MKIQKKTSKVDRAIDRKGLFFSGAVIIFVASFVFYGTNALFSDTEISTGNTFTAGAIDLKIDNESYITSTTTGELVFSPSTSWQMSDLTDQLFFDFEDLKPGDVGEDTISLHVSNNEAWACMNLDITATPENGQTGPEAKVDTTAGENEGELQNELEFIFWADDGDNVFEEGETVIKSGKASEIFDGQTFALADSQNQNLWNQQGPLSGEAEAVYHVGKAWCFGELTETPLPSGADTSPLERGTGISCDGMQATNATQTDGVKASVSFYAVQSRNNLDYICNPPEKPRITVVEGTNDSPIELNYHLSPTDLKWFAKLKNINGSYERVIGLPVSPFIEGDWSLISYGDAIWVPNEVKTFTLSYDSAGTASLAVEGYDTLTYAVGPETLSRLAITLKAPTGVTTEVHDLVFDRGILSIDSLTTTNRTRYLLIEGVDLSTGFVLSGKFSFSSFPAFPVGVQDNPRIGFFVD